MWIRSLIGTVTLTVTALITLHAIDVFPLPGPTAQELALRARVERASGRREIAIALCDQAISLDPDLADAYLTKSAAILDAGDTVQALRTLDDLIGKPGRASQGVAHRTKGDIYLSTEQWEMAVVSYTTAIELDPRDRRAYLARWEAYSHLVPPEWVERWRSDRDR